MDQGDGYEAAANGIAFAMLSAAFRAVSSVMLHTDPDNARPLLQMLHDEVHSAIAEFECVRPDLAKDGVVKDAARRAQAVLQSVGAQSEQAN